MPEFMLLLLGPNTEHIEHPRLERRLMDTDGPAPKLYAIKHHVIGNGAHFAELPAIKQWQIFRMRAG